MNQKRTFFLQVISLNLLWLAITFSDYALAEMQLKSTGGFTISDPADKAYWFTVGGRLHLDETLFLGNAYDKQSGFPSGANLRRLYLNFKGGVGKNWSYDSTLSFKGRTTTIRAAYLAYLGVENSNLRFGQIGIPTGLENWSDSNNWMFLEGSLLTGTFFPSENFGLGVYANRTFSDLFTLAGAVFQPRQGMLNYGDSGRSDRLGEALRLTFSPIHTECLVYHLGLWGRHQSVISTVAGVPVSTTLGFQGFSDVPEAQARNTGSLVNTGPIRAKSYGLAGIEAAAIFGPVTVQAEYLLAQVHRVKSSNDPVLLGKSVHFYSWYIEGGYVLTGESRGYDFSSGTIGRVKPTCASGAWEIVGRYSMVDLVDRNIYGGTEHNVSVGLNWFVNEQVRISTNYVHAMAHPTSVSVSGSAGFPKRTLDILAARLQVVF